MFTQRYNRFNSLIRYGGPAVSILGIVTIVSSVLSLLLQLNTILPVIRFINLALFVLLILGMAFLSAVFIGARNVERDYNLYLVAKGVILTPNCLREFMRGSQVVGESVSLGQLVVLLQDRDNLDGIIIVHSSQGQAFLSNEGDNLRTVEWHIFR